ncbi:MAG: hypothetical protein CL930_04790 [Deltaproteobacteria bacterium]|nr:hypothetical protein [Deltaproteobacteria bacterium]
MSEARTQTRIAVFIALAVGLGLLWRPLLSMHQGLWGPADPWNNGDFLGARWLFWAVAQSGDPTQMLHYPWGEDSILSNFPNPFDAWLFGPLVTDIKLPIWWNAMTLGHHLLNISATVFLARATGARTLHAAAAGVLVAASPIMLHEHTLGHTLTAAVWPGLFGLAALVRGRGVLAGLWIGIQGLAYLYAGLAFGLLALLIRPSRGLMSAFVIIAPYLFLLFPQFSVASAATPPDGYTSLPLDGLLWLSQQPQVRLHPLLLVGFLAPALGASTHRRYRRRIALGALILLVLAFGPSVFGQRGDPALFDSPFKWLFTIPGLSRMHHPIRLGMIVTPLLAVCAALAMHRKRSFWVLLAILSALPTWKTIDNTGSWPESATPPGHDAALWLRNHASAVVDLGSRSSEALALQPIHGKPVLSGLHPRNNPRAGLDAKLFRRVNAWAEGIPQPGLPAQLKHLGFTHILVVDRSPHSPVNSSAVETALGKPVYPGVYKL